MNVHISRPDSYIETLAAFKKWWRESLHILADFDNTLTYALKNGQKRSSLISLLRQWNYLGEDYSKQAYALFDEYHPFEIDQNISLFEKKKKMKEWRDRHLDLLVQSRLHKSDIDDALAGWWIELRQGVREMIDLLNEHKIPLIIMSANGLWSDSIRLYLEQKNISQENIHIISNTLIWDDSGYAIGKKEPIIHSLNKDETAIGSFPELHFVVRNRINVLLLGDSQGDPGMVSGFEYENLLKIGFLNRVLEEEIEEYMGKYQDLYDLVLTGDPWIYPINSILQWIVN